MSEHQSEGPPAWPNAIEERSSAAGRAAALSGAGAGGGRPMSRREGEDRLLTVPNLITSIRLALIPVFVWLLFGRHNRAGAAVMLAALGSTDWVDGTVARRFNQV